jgi:hypothetical protein
VRYAIAPSIADRRTAATALKNWLSAQREVASQIFESKPPAMAEPKAVMAMAASVDSEPQTQVGGLKTVAEQAVDRVTHGIKLRKVSAGL